MTSRRKPCSSDSHQCLSRSLLGGRAPLPDPPPALFLCFSVSVRQAGCLREAGWGQAPRSIQQARYLLQQGCSPCSLGPGASLTRSFPPQPEIRAMPQPAIVGDGSEHSASPAPSQCPGVWCAHACARHLGKDVSRRWVKGSPVPDPDTAGVVSVRLLRA